VSLQVGDQLEADVLAGVARCRVLLSADVPEAASRLCHRGCDVGQRGRSQSFATLGRVGPGGADLQIVYLHKRPPKMRRKNAGAMDDAVSLADKHNSEETIPEHPAKV